VTTEIELLQKYTSKRVPLRLGKKAIMIKEDLVNALNVISEHSEADISLMLEDALTRLGIENAADKLLKIKAISRAGSPVSAQNGVTQASGAVSSSGDGSALLTAE